MTHLVLLRHGQTEANLLEKGPPETRVICGQYDTQLTPKGRIQGTHAGRKIAGIPFVNVVTAISSDLIRAVDTLELVRVELPSTVLLPPDPALRERSCGIFDGRLKMEVQAEYPQYFTDPLLKHWRAHFEQKAPSGENFTDVTHRVRTCIDELLQNTSGDILVVAHIRVFCCLLYSLLNLSKEQAIALAIPNAEPIIVKMDNSNTLIGEWTLERLLFK